MSTERTTVHIARPTKEERELLRLLSAVEKLEAMVEAARRKAGRLGELEIKKPAEKPVSDAH